MTSSPEGGRGVVVGINSIETIEVESGVELGYAAVNNLSEGEVAVVGDSRTNAGEGQTSYDNQTQTAGLLHSVRNDMSGYAQETISPLERKELQNETKLSFSNSREGNVLAPNGINTLTQNSNAHKFALT